MTFKLISFNDYPDTKTQVSVFEHLETKAKHYHTHYDTTENSFSISFRTLPDNDKGTAHILEHCILNGSKKYPYNGAYSYIKNKNFDIHSNASTSYDNTQFHFTSIHEKGFFNLLDFYLDAVFFPLLKEETFRQEGWRYSIPIKDKNEKLDIHIEDIEYKGIVFNEMIGAFANMDKVIGVSMRKQCFPNSQYVHYSGGYPQEIPSLTYQDFLNFYKKYYQPSNATIHTFGNFSLENFHNQVDTVLSNYIKDNNINSTKKIAFKISPLTISSGIHYGEHPGQEGYVYIKNYQLEDFKTVGDYYHTLVFLKLLQSEDNIYKINELLLQNNIKASFKGMHLLGINSPVISINFEMTQDNHENIDTIFNTFLTQNVVQLSDQQLKNIIDNLEIFQREGNCVGKNIGLNKINSYINLQRYNIENFIDINNINLIEENFHLFNQFDYFKNCVFHFLLNNQNTSSFISVPNPQYSEQLHKKIKQTLFNNLNKDFINFNNNTLPLAINDNKKTDKLSFKSHFFDNILQTELNIELYQKKSVNQENIPKLRLNDLLDIPNNRINPYTTKREWTDNIRIENTKYNLYPFTEKPNGVDYLNISYPIVINNEEDLFYFHLTQELSNQLTFKDSSMEETQLWKKSHISYIYNIIESFQNHDNSIQHVFSIKSKGLEENTDILLNKIISFNQKIDWDNSHLIYQLIEQSYQNYLYSNGKNQNELASYYSKSSFSLLYQEDYLLSSKYYQQFLLSLIQNKKPDLLIKNLKKYHNRFFTKKPDVFYFGHQKAINIIKMHLDNSLFDLNVKSDHLTTGNNYFIPKEKNIIINESTSSSISYSIQTVNRKHEDAVPLLMFVNYIKSYINQEIRVKNTAYGTAVEYSKDIITISTSRDPTPSKSLDIINNISQFILNNIVDINLFNTNKINLLKSFYIHTSPINEAQEQFMSLLKDTYIDYNEFYEKIMKLNPNDIQYMAKKYFSNVSPIVTIVTNEENYNLYFKDWYLLHNNKSKKIFP